jgi:hypothetical protein
VAYAAILLMHLQVAVLYFPAAVAKFSATEWSDGMVMYYWFNRPTFGAAPWLRPVTKLIDGLCVAVAGVTWRSIGFELAPGRGGRAAAPGPTRPARRRAHLPERIALCMGLVSFDIAMSAALLLYLMPIGQMMPAPRSWLRLRAAWQRSGLRRSGLPGRVQVAKPTQQLA